MTQLSRHDKRVLNIATVKINEGKNTMEYIKRENDRSRFRAGIRSLTFMLMLLNLTGYAQVFDLNNVVLFKTGVSSKGLKWGQSTSTECEILFGKPTSVEGFYSEIDEDTLQLYKYGKNELYFDKGVLRSFDLVDALMSIGDSNGNTFKIGDKVKIKNGVKSFFDFKINDKPGNSWNLDYQAYIFANLKKEGKVMDSALSILFDKNYMLFNVRIWD